MPKDERREFLAVYEYGMGGVWLKVKAQTPDEITSRYPQLTVYPAGERPDWMSEAEEETYTSRMRFDVAAPEGWLAALSGD